MSALFVDMGTTTTRVWMGVEDRVVARATARVGVADAARAGSSEPVRRVLRQLVGTVREEGRRAGAPEPRYVAAAGMIGSPLGLAVVPHVEAPASAAELAARVERHRFPEVCELEFLLVPGVRTGPERVPPEGIGATDVMRGEETLCVGLLERGWLRPGGALLNLGSHWKLVSIDGRGRIAASRTTLSGELAFAAQTQTILASSLPREWPQSLDLEWVERGVELQREAGLARALFSVRLAEQRAGCTPEQRLALLLGAVAAADLDPLRDSGALPPGTPLVLAGGGAAAGAVRQALAPHDFALHALTSEQVEEAQLGGLRSLVGRAAAG